MKLRRNIPLMYVIDALMWGRFFVPVLALFYVASQVPLEQFSIIMGVFSLSILLFEIPTGVLADLLGKKKTLILGRSMYIVEIFIIAFFNGFWPFFIAKIISGFGVSLGSGTNEALLYDTLKKQKREKEHKLISGSLYTVTNVAMAVVFITGSFLFSIDSKLPALVSLPAVAFGLFLTFFLEEPYRNGRKLNMKNYLKHFKEGLTYFNDNKYVKYLALLSIPVAAFTSIMLSLSSAYFKEILIPVVFIGTLAFLSAMTQAFSSKISHRLEDKLGEKRSLFLVQILTLVGVGLMSLVLPYFGVLFYFIVPFVASFFMVITNDYINSSIGSSHRATVLSVTNMFRSIGIALIFPLVGFFINLKNMQTSFFYLGIFILAYFILLFVYYKSKNLKKIK